MQIGLGVAPVPHRDDDVALDALRALRLGLGQFAGGDAVGPVGEIAQRALGVDLADVAHHGLGGGPDLDAVAPGLERGLELAERRRDRAGRLVAELVAGIAAVGLERGQPLALALEADRHAVAARSGAGEQALVRNLEHRVPVLRRIIFRRRRRIRRRHRGQVENLAGRGCLLGRIDQPIAAHPDVVIGLRQIRQHVAALIVGDDDLDEFGRQVGGLGDHPDAGLRPARARHHAAEIARRRCSPARRCPAALSTLVANALTAPASAIAATPRYQCLAVLISPLLLRRPHSDIFFSSLA